MAMLGDGEFSPLGVPCPVMATALAFATTEDDPVGVPESNPIARRNSGTVKQVAITPSTATRNPAPLNLFLRFRFM